MRNAKIALMTLMILNAACSSAPTKETDARTQYKNAKDSAQAQSSSQGELEYVSLSRKSSFAQGTCPATAQVWRGESLKNILNYATVCAQSGQFEKLEQLGQYLAQNHYQMAWGPYYLSLVAESRKQYQRALWMLDLGIKRESENALLYYQKGRIHWSLGEFTTAVKNFQYAIDKNSKFVDAHLFLGQMFYRDHNFKQAQFHFENSKKYQPDHIDATLGLAETHSALKNEKLALAYYEELVSLAPTRILFRFKLATLHESVSKDLPKALSGYKKVREMSLANSRQPADVTPIDINERIQKIEAHLAAEAKAKAAVEAAKDATTAKADTQKKVKK
jgi:tetratricopeptide (TPR) repeat protein